MKFSKDDTLKVKGVAILLLIFHHLFMNSARYVGYDVDFGPFAESSINMLAGDMKICVGIFTFLSAYGIAFSYLNKKDAMTREGIEHNILRRYLKLISGFVVVYIALCIAYAIIDFDGLVNRFGKNMSSVVFVIVDMLGLSQIFHTPPLIQTFWYMSLAVIIIFIMPLLIYIYKKFGALVLLGVSVVFAMLFPVHVKNAYDAGSHAFLPVYIICVVFGILAADKKWFEALSNALSRCSMVKKVLIFLCYLVLLYVTLHVRREVKSMGLFPVLEAISVVMSIAFLHNYINRIPVLSHVLKILGIYSMNMFLIHNFIRYVWFYDFTYGFENMFIIYAVLVLISLAISVVLEEIKKIIKVDKWVDLLLKRVAKERR